MKIDQGLFKLDFSDHHAILGIPVNTPPKDVRKRYLKIARKLHPDSLRGASEEEKQQASEYLSKLVNPAYETLNQEKLATEHALVLRMKGQQLSQQSPLDLASEAARQLLSSTNVEHAYVTALKPLAEQQYESLADFVSVTGQISELNLAYVVRTAGENKSAAPAAKPAVASEQATQPQSASAAPTPAPPPPPPRRESILERYLSRAKTMEDKGDYAQAILELRDALQAYPKSAICHRQLAGVYLKAGQPTMAKVHAKRALAIKPDDEIAQAIQKRLSKENGQTSRDNKTSQAGKSRSGLFGLFGGKKK